MKKEREEELLSLSGSFSLLKKMNVRLILAPKKFLDIKETIGRLGPVTKHRHVDKIKRKSAQKYSQKSLYTL